MRKKLAAAIYLMTMVVACQSPLPPLPPPGAITTPDEAIRIAMNVCDPQEPSGRVMESWNARREGDLWIASFESRQRRPQIHTVSVEIHSQDGKASECLFEGTITLH